MKNMLIPALMCVTLLLTVNLSAQNDGDYRTINTGNWTAIAIWERFNGALMDWEAATTAPNSNDGVIAIRADHTVTVNAAVTADEIVVESGGILAITSFVLTLNDGPGDDLVVHGTLNQSGSTLGGAGSTARIASDGVFNASGNAKTWNATVTNDGMINWSSNSQTTATALFTNNGTVTITGNTTHSGAATNNGTITKTSSGLSQYNTGTFTNHGTIDVQAGTLRHTQTFTNHSTLMLTSATLLSDGPYTHETGATITGSGVVDINNALNLNTDLDLPAGISLDNAGTITGDGNLTLNSNFTFSGGTISGNGTFVVNGDIAWSGGTLARALTIPNGRTMTISGGAKTFSAPLTNDGVINWTAAVITGTALLTNNGTLNISSNVNHEGAGGVVNHGMITKTSAGTTRYHQGPFTNHGTIDVQAGTFRHSSNTFDNNSIITLTSATLLISDNYNHNTGAMILGSGTLDNDGTITLNVDLNLPAGTIVDNSGTITGPGDLTINNDLTLSGTISGTGVLAVNGDIIWTSGTLARSLTVPVGRTLTMSSSLKNLNATLTNQGTSIWSGGGVTQSSMQTGSFVNEGLWIWSINNTNGFSVNGGFFNTGIMRKTSTGVNNNLQGGPVTNSGAIEIQAGTWGQTSAYINNTGGTITGTGIFRNSQSMTLNADLEIPAGIELQNSTANITGDGNLTLHGTLTNGISSTIDGAGILTIHGTFTWTSSSVSRNMFIEPGGTLTMSGSDQKSLNGSLTNNGTVNWTGGNIVAGAGALTTNNTIINISSNAFHTGNSGGFINNGTVIKTSTGTTTYTTPSTNNGTIEVSNGTLSLSGAVDNMGPISLNGTTLSISGTTQHNTGSMMLGTGALNVSGTLNLNIDLDLPSGITLTNSGTITGPGNLTVNNDLTLSGTFSGTGALAVHGDISWTSGTLARSLTVLAGRTLTMSSSLKNLNTTLTNQGTCIWSGGGVTQSDMATGTFINEGLWIWSINNTNGFSVNGGFFNTGIMRKTSTGVNNNLQGGPVTNSGAIEIQAGTWGQTSAYINNTGGTITGTGIFRNSQSMTLNADLEIPAGIELQNSTANITGAGNLTLHGTLTNGISSTIDGAGILTIHGTFTWTSSSVSRNMFIEPGGTLTMSGSDQKSLNGSLTNNGTVNWSGGNIVSGAGASTTNNTTIHIGSNTNHSGTGGFINNGTISKTSTSTTTYSTAFTNSPTGVIQGVGTYSFSTLTNNGTIEPGLSPGVLTINNNQPFSSNSTLIIEMNGGGAPGVVDGHDQLRRTSTDLLLDGTLTIVETAPVPDGDYVVIELTSGTITGSFAQTNLPPFYTLEVTSTQVILTKENPTISCPENVTLNNEAGLCSAVVIDIDPNVSPGGTDFMYALSGATSGNGDGTASGQAFNVGTTTVTYIVTLAQNVACSLDVTMLDVDLPTVNCPENISVNNDPGLCSAVVNYSVPFSDNCPSAMISQTQGLASGSAFPVGMTTNTFVVMDAHGNTSLCSFTVTVTDNEVPSVTCPENIAVNNDPGLCSAVVNYAVLFDDNCPGAMISQTQGLASGSAFPVGMTTNTFVVMDAHGNTSSCSFTVTVADHEAPSVTCPENIAVNNDPGLCSAVVNYAVPFSDNCPGAMISQTQGLASGSAFPVGMTTNTFVVMDAHGNTSSCSFTITVTDNEAPSIHCPDNIVAQQDEVVNYNVLFGDNCPGAILTQTGGLPSGSFFPEGVTTNTFEVEDASGNINNCSFEVTVVNEDEPLIICPANVITSTIPGQCTKIVHDIDPVSVFPLEADYTYTLTGATIGNGDGSASGLSFNPGVTTVTYALTEDPGVSCFFTVTLNTHPEVCNGLDDDCDGLIDDDDPDISGQSMWYADADGDGFGDSNDTVLACNQPLGYVANDNDCDDTDPDVNPNAPEVCNGLDDDCDGLIDDDDPDITGQSMWYADADGDGYGDPGDFIFACAQPETYVDNNDDCNDADPNIHPGAPEICNGLDDDCDGLIDDDDPDITGQSTWYADADGDGFGTSTNSVSACAQPAGFVLNDGDCDDTNPNINPNAPEVCNGIDDNCDSFIDEGCPGENILINIDHLTIVHESVGTALIRVTLSAPSTTTISVTHSSLDGTAKQPRDYLRARGTVVFMPGQTLAWIPVVIIQDNFPEANEHFKLRLVAVTGNAFIENGQGQVVITETMVNQVAPSENPVAFGASDQSYSTRSDLPDHKRYVQTQIPEHLSLPNPVSRTSVLHIPYFSPGAFDIQLYNFEGRLLLQYDAYVNDKTMESLHPGMYIYRIILRDESPGRIWTIGKIIVVD